MHLSTSEKWPVRTNDGHQLELLAEVPDRPRAVLLFVCALGIEASYYAKFAEAMAARGVALAMCDLRGNGTSSLRPKRGVDFGYQEIVEEDIPAAITVVRDRMPSVPLFVGGHSLGGQLVVLHVAAQQPDIAGVVLVACAIPYYRNWTGRDRRQIRLVTRLYPILGFLLGYVPGKRFGFGGTEARTVMRDWAHNAITALYEPRGSTVDYEAALREIDMAFVTVNIEGDRMGPPNAVDFMFDKVPKARGERVEAKLTERKPGAHFRWARDPDGVVEAVARWIENR